MRRRADDRRKSVRSREQSQAADRLPNVRFWNLYGQTEMAPLATALQPEDALRKPGSVSKPTLNVETRVVDPDMLGVQPGEVGEIVHRSPQLLMGYCQAPDGNWRQRSTK